MLKRKIINKAFTIILISILSLIYTNQLLANNAENNANDSKKCIVYKDGKLMYNPDNPKIHCTTLQILDNYWDDNNTNVPNPNKKPEDFTEILTLKDITSNGNIVCKNPSVSNATFTTKEALEDETISGTCNTGYTGTVSATCQKDGSWSINNNCFSDCNNLENMYADSSFINTIKTISNDEFAFSKCDNGYDGFKKHKCEDGKLETTNVCSIIKCNDLVNMYKENTFANETSSINHNEFAYEKCGVGYEGHKEYICNSGTIEISNDACEIISGCTEFAFHTDEQYLDVPSTGFANVKMQVWGAQGGVQWDTTRNFGGYGYGELDSIAGNEKIRVRIGQYGGTRPVINYVPIGAGNGGAITNKCYGVTTKTRAGGGGSKIWVDGDFQLQAGGGGGDADGNGNVGAAGGGANIDGGSTWLATGGTTNSHGKSCDGQTVTRTSNENGDPNTANHDDNNMSCGGGGGGGYYGGGSCGYALQNGIKYTSGGGGGSGYASSKFKNTDSSTNGTKVGNGFARICWGNSKACNGGAFDHQTSVCDITYSNANSNAVEIYYGNTKGFFRQGQTVKCNGKSFGLSGNNGSSCFTPGKLHEYASEGNSFQAW